MTADCCKIAIRLIFRLVTVRCSCNFSQFSVHQPPSRIASPFFKLREASSKNALGRGFAIHLELQNH